MEQLRKRKYLALLSTLLLLIVAFPLLRTVLAARLIYDALLATVFLLALVTVFTPRRRLLAVLLGVPTMVGLWVGYVLPDLPRVPLVVAFHSSAAVFLGFALVAILADVYRRERIDVDGVYGALCGYLLVGLGFGHVYCIVETANPGSFHANEEIRWRLRDESEMQFELSYFSFTTLTTLGYGDVTPARGGARGLAIVEAMLGQFYVAVLLGELIGKKVSQAITDKPPDPPGASAPGY